VRRLVSLTALARTGPSVEARCAARTDEIAGERKAYIESLNGRVRDELRNGEAFSSLLAAQVVVETGATITTPAGRTPPSRCRRRPLTPYPGNAPAPPADRLTLTA
jgi:hypothetical protein